MGLFGRGKSGGMLNVIRCDEQEYLVWKWRPEGQDANSTTRENSIRYGSSLRVKDGEVAIFVYQQKNGAVQDYIVGPYDETIKTANFPVLSSIVGLAFGGDSPFQAEIYFINLAGNIQIRFAIPYFDVFDPRIEYPIPFAVRGSLTFNITDYEAFVKLNRLINFTLEDFNNQIKDAVTSTVKRFVTNCPSQHAIPALKIESKIADISDAIKERLTSEMANDFGVNLKRIDIGAIEPDKEHENYQNLVRLTAGQEDRKIEARTEAEVKLTGINVENTEDLLGRQREEWQRQQRLQTETNFMGAHALDQQVSVMQTAAGSLGSMGSVNLGGDGSGGMNPAGMMTGMMMGGAMGNQMVGMVNSMGQMVQNSMNTPPPPPSSNYMVSVNGQQTGPYTIPQLTQLIQQGQVTRQTYVWKNGMANWEFAGNVPELSQLFGAVPPPPPPPMP